MTCLLSTILWSAPSHPNTKKSISNFSQQALSPQAQNQLKGGDGEQYDENGILIEEIIGG